MGKGEDKLSTVCSRFEGDPSTASSLNSASDNGSDGVVFCLLVGGVSGPVNRHCHHQIYHRLARGLGGRGESAWTEDRGRRSHRGH